MGAIGPVLGNYYSTLSQLASHLKDDGIIIIGDAYVEDNCGTDYPNVLKKGEIIQQIGKAGMELIDIITTNDEITVPDEEYEKELENMGNRCGELIEKYPEDKKVFLDYLAIQKELTWKLINEVTQAIFVIGLVR